MADAAVLAEAYKRGLLPPDKAAAYEEGVRRGILPGGAAKPSTLKDAAKSYISGFGESLAGIESGMLRTSLPGMIVKNATDAANLTSNVVSMVRGEKPAPQIPQLNEAGARLMTRAAHKPETTAGQYAHAAGVMTPNLLAPGSIPARVANVILPALTSETAAQGVRSFGGGEKAQDLARVVGGVAGAGASSIRAVPFRPQSATELLSTRARQDPARMTDRAREYRDVGIEPAPIDIIDDAGRGAVRAAASRMTPGRQRANDVATSRALDLPSRISGQARRHMSADPRTPDEIRATMTRQRSTNADAAFGAVRGETIPLAEDTVATLRTDYGRRAIQEAASRERDPEVRAALNRLHGDALDNPGGTEITIGMADRISRVLHGQGQAATRAGDNELAGLLHNLAEGVRQPARSASTGYAEALEGYGADSRLQQAAGVGEGLMTRNTDEFTAQAGRLAPEERELALAAGRRAIERKAGENVSSAPGVARALADAPEQRSRNAALMGAERADRLQQGMRLEERATANARDIAPKNGSGTATFTADAERVAGAVKAGGQALRGDWMGMGLDWLKSRGISDRQAEELVHLATDPARTDAFLAAATARLGARRAQQFLEYRNAAMVGVTATSAAAAAPGQQAR